MRIKFGFLTNGILLGVCWYDTERSSILELDLLVVTFVFEKDF